MILEEETDYFFFILRPRHFPMGVPIKYAGRRTAHHHHTQSLHPSPATVCNERNLCEFFEYFVSLHWNLILLIESEEKKFLSLWLCVEE